MTFHINHKAYTVDIGDDLDNRIEDGIKKYLNLDTNIDTSDLLLAYIKKTHQLVELEKSLEKLSTKIDEIK
jgi:lipase chaperone LimK